MISQCQYYNSQFVAIIATTNMYTLSKKFTLTQPNNSLTSQATLGKSTDTTWWSRDGDHVISQCQYYNSQFVAIIATTNVYTLSKKFILTQPNNSLTSQATLGKSTDTTS